MLSRRQVATLEVETEQLCIFVVTKNPIKVIQLEVDEDIKKFVETHAILSLLQKTRHVEAVNLNTDSILKGLQARTDNAEFCRSGLPIVQQYSTTLRSRSALVVIAKFRFGGKSFVGFFQLRETAVMALYPMKKELKVIESAFKRFEKASLLPSMVEGHHASIFQRAKSKYFEKFVGVDRPPTAEEALEVLVDEKGIENLSELLLLLEQYREGKQAKVTIELNQSRTKLRADEIIRTLARNGVALILINEGAQAAIRIGKRVLSVDLESLHDFGQVLKDRGIP